jgi:hypothetical protein
MINVNQQKISFTASEVESINKCILELEQMLQNKTVQLTKEQSRYYGKLGKEKEKWAEEMHKDISLDSQLIAPYMDLTNFNDLEKLRETLNGMINRLTKITQQMVHTNRVVGFNLYHECKNFYEFVKLMSTKNMPGLKFYYDKWSAIFHKKNKVKTPKTEGSNG